jgi:hypothetical protein
MAINSSAGFRAVSGGSPSLRSTNNVSRNTHDRVCTQWPDILEVNKKNFAQSSCARSFIFATSGTSYKNQTKIPAVQLKNHFFPSDLPKRVFEVFCTEVQKVS